MVIIISALVLLFLALGHFVLKRMRRKLHQERERKMHIAAGTIREELPAVQTQGRRKKGWFYKRKKTLKFIMSEREERLLIKRVGETAEEVLKRWHNAKELQRILSSAEAEHASALSASNALALPQRPDRVEFRSWLAGCLETKLRMLRTWRVYHEADRNYRNARMELVRWITDLENALKLEHYDVSDLLIETDRALEMARLILIECRTPAPPANLVSATEGEPKEADAEIEGLLEQVMEALENALSAWSEASIACADIAKDDDALTELRKGLPALQIPAKPIEADVQSMIDGALEWARNVQAKKLVLQAKYGPVHETVGLMQSGAHAVRKLLNQFAELETRRAEEARLRQLARFQWASDSLPTETPVEAEDAASVAPPKPEGPAPRGWFGLWRTPAPVKAKEKLPPPVVPPPVIDKWCDLSATAATIGLYTDNQRARKSVAEMVADEIARVGAQMDTRLRGWHDSMGVDYKDSNPEGDEQRCVEQMLSAMRKFGFALAQLANAETKYKECYAESVREAAESPTLALPTPDSFVKCYQKWRTETARAATLAEQKKQRLADLAEQLEQRRAQVKDCAAKLASAKSALKSAGGPNTRVAAEARRAIRLLQKKFAPPEKA